MSYLDESVIEGRWSVPAECRFAVVASRFNHLVVDRLIEGAVHSLRMHGVDGERVDVLRVPGAWELPLAAELALQSGRYDALIVLGAVIRGATAHFDFVAGPCVQSLQRLMVEHRRPIALGLLTTDSIEQAVERAGTKAGNKGEEAARSALEMVSLAQRLGAAAKR